MSTSYYVADHETGAPLCADCAEGDHGLCAGPCEGDWCQCWCQADRAAELDDRPLDKLAAVAAELAAERDGDVRDLTAERFGQPRRGAA
jgi:hypothetical protein